MDKERRLIIAGNWKMNLDRAGAVSLAERIVKQAAKYAVVEMAVCPPYVYLEDVQKVVAGTPIGRR